MSGSATQRDLDSRGRGGFEKYRDAGQPYPTSLDLFAELRAVTPDSVQSLLTDWFENITLWDVRTERAVVEQTDTGEYRVTLDVVARRNTDPNNPGR